MQIPAIELSQPGSWVKVANRWSPFGHDPSDGLLLLHWRYPKRLTFPAGEICTRRSRDSKEARRPMSMPQQGDLEVAAVDLATPHETSSEEQAIQGRSLRQIAWRRLK